MNLQNKPNLTLETIKGMEDMSFFTYAQIFDDLLIVANKGTACFVYKTFEELIIIDGIWPNKLAYDAIINAIKNIGWDENNIKKFIITHGHADHTGCGKWFVENYNATTYLSEVDDIYWENHPTKPNKPDTWKNFNIDVYLKEGDIISCTDKKIFVYETPGHTPGCLSFIFPVHEDKKIHMAGIFGGITPPWNDAIGTEQFLCSLEYFIESAKQNHVDVALCNHTAFDNGLERISYSKKRLAYMPNIYIVGESGVIKFFEGCKNNEL